VTTKTQTKFGSHYVAKELGITREEMWAAAMMDDCPSVCRVCGAINESGHEPDAREYDCEDCGAAGTVNSVLVIAGMI